MLIYTFNYIAPHINCKSPCRAAVHQMTSMSALRVSYFLAKQQDSTHSQGPRYTITVKQEMDSRVNKSKQEVTNYGTQECNVDMENTDGQEKNLREETITKL